MNAPSNDLLRLAWTQCWQVTVLVVAVGLVTWLACRRRPHLAYVLWMLVVLKCLTPPVWSSPAGLFSWMQMRQGGTVLVAAADQVRPPVSPPIAERPISSPAPPELQRIDPASPTHTAMNPLESAPQPVRSGFSITPTQIAVAAWLAGLGLLAGLIALQVTRCRRRVRSRLLPTPPWLEAMASQVSEQLGLRRRVRLIVTAAPIGPLTTGLVQPTVILPQAVLAGRDAEQVRPILAHELIHVRRRDVLFGLLQSAAQLMLWFHPLVWWANRQASREVERCCDEEVVAGLQCPPGAYARCLVDVLEMQHSEGAFLAVPGMRSMGVTRQRLEDILQRAGQFHRRTPVWCWAILLTVAVVVLPGAGRMAGGQGLSGGGAMNVPTDAADQTVITGQVLDPSGKALAGVDVAAVVCGMSWWQLPDSPQPLAQGVTDEQGKFQLTGRAVSWPQDVSVSVFAYHDGYAIACQEFFLPSSKYAEPDRSRSRFEAALRFELPEPAEGSIVDSHGDPAAGVNIAVHTYVRKAQEKQSLAARYPVGQTVSQPPAVTTDEQGRFTLPYVQRGAYVLLRIDDERFAPRLVEMQIGQEPVQIALGPRKVLDGTVIFEDGGKPVPHAKVTVVSFGKDPYHQVNEPVWTDADGRFRMVPLQGHGLSVVVQVPGDATYELIVYRPAERLLKARQRFVVPKGVTLHGTVVEVPGGKPVAGAEVFWKQDRKDDLGQVRVITDAKGAFTLTASPGRSGLTVGASNPEYVPQVIGSGEMYYGQPGGYREYPDGFMLLDLNPEMKEMLVTVRLRRGLTLRGSVTGPQGQPVLNGEIRKEAYFGDSWHVGGAGVFPIRNGQFELPGMDPQKPEKVYFIDAENQWGAMVELDPKAAQPLTVQLQRCGAATVRFVGPDGKPSGERKDIGGPSYWLQLIAAPGYSGPVSHGHKEMEAHEWTYANLDYKRYKDMVPDADGKVIYPTLIPGATYRIARVSAEQEGALTRDFTVEPGQTIDLGQIELKPPRTGSTAGS